MRKPLIDIKYFKQRRDRLKSMAGKDEALILFSGYAPRRSNDTNYKFRVNSNFFYLTGFQEEGAILVYRPGKTPETVVFVHPKDPTLETWEGFMFGKDLAKTTFNFDETYLEPDFDSKIVDLLLEIKSVYFKIGEDSKQDERVLSAMKMVLKKKGRKGYGFQEIKDPDVYMAGLRVIKTEEEIKFMKKAAKVSAKAHIKVMKTIRPGVNEAYLEGVFLSEAMKLGAKNLAYNTISASGNNATTLHYVFNDQECKDGDLYLIDAGVEYEYYTGDITRTYPVGADFTKIQKDVYQKILEVQKDIVALVKPGITFKLLIDRADKVLTKIMIDLGLLKGSIKENIEKKLHKKYYPHGIGHFLGIDVHDIGFYEKNNEEIFFQPGMCLTIEPGLYIPKDDIKAPLHLRGIGIRIEDDILVTRDGHENMTKLVPKEINEMLALKKDYVT